MLQRSESVAEPTDECEDALVKIACSLGSDECPAACQEDEEEEESEEVVVKSGDLVVTAEAADGRKVTTNGISDLDTLTFKTSEEVEITKVTLERYGYSSADEVEGVRLEDEDGNVIAEAKTLSKDKATLSIKKDYRTVDGTLNATVVVELSGASAGGTIGFKVSDVTSTAENLNLKNYDANTYDMVSYSGTTAKVELKGTAKDHNYEAGESYEVARIKVSAYNSAVYVKGFTLTNASGLDVAEFLDDVTVTVDGEELDGVKANVNKDDELVISFDEVAIEMNKNETFVVNMSFTDEFDEYGQTIAYYFAETADFNAVEKKTGARLSINGTYGLAYAVAHTFNGGKIKISNTKLGNIDAAQGSEDVVVAEGNITITESISKLSFAITANNTGVENMTFVVNGDEYEGKRTVSGTDAVFKFNNVEIEKSGKAQFKIDIEDNDNVAGSVTFSTFNKDAFAGAKYDEANEYVQTSEVAGSISFSKVTIQAAKASLKNNTSKDIEFLYNETNRKVVFEGTYTAKKADVYLDSFYINGSTTDAGTTITYYLSIDGEEVADTDTYGSSSNEETFSEVLVEAGESVSVKVEAEVEAYGSTGVTYDNIYLVLGGHDVNDKDVAYAQAKLVTMKVKESGSTTISTATERNTVLLKASTQTLAKFTVKPSNSSDDDLVLDNITFTITGTSALYSGDLNVWFDGIEEDASSESVATTGNTIKYEPDTDLGDGIEVIVEIDREYTGTVELTVTNVNGKSQTKTFNKRYEEALVYVESQEDLDGSTKFYLAVETADSDTTVSDVRFYAGSDCLYTGNQEVVDGDDIEIVNSWNGGAAKMIDKIVYSVSVDGVDQPDVTIEKTTYNDYFKVGSTYAKVFKVD